MTVLPVIARELRASARQPFTYYLRVLGVTALLVASLLFGFHLGFVPAFGRELFQALHCTLLGAIWVLVPMLTADCISRERREGTLGLLFLTPLKGTDIVVAKGLVHGLRAMTLWVAVLPVLTVPFLMGGVSWADAALSVTVNANAMCCALAAGLLASAWSKVWLRAMMWAGMLAFVFFLLLATEAGWFLLQALSAKQPGRIEISAERAMATGFLVLTSLGGGWLFRWGGVNQITLALAQTTLVSLVVLVAAVLAAGARIRHSWQEAPLSPRQVRWQQAFCTPVLWVAFFRRWMRRRLERNPIGWLEQRTWSGRLVTWGWFAVLVSIYSVALTDPYFRPDPNDLQETMAWLLAGSMALSATGSFRRERENGMLELLLVSPLGENQIISGRLGGLWSQFLPAAGLLLVVWLYFWTFQPEPNNTGAFLYAVVSFLTVPVVGLYYSLRCSNFIIGFLATIAVGLLLPLVLSALLGAVWWAYAHSDSVALWDMRPSWRAAVCQGLLAAVCWHLLHRRLKQRAFPLERTETL